MFQEIGGRIFLSLAEIYKFKDCRKYRDEGFGPN